MPNDELMHYGRLHMRWGMSIFGGKKSDAARRRRGGTVRKAKTTPKKTESKPKGAMELTNEELDTAINRMRKISDFNKLYAELNPKKVSKGKQFVSDLVDAVGKGIINAAQETAKNALVNATKKMMDNNNNNNNNNNNRRP